MFGGLSLVLRTRLKEFRKRELYKRYDVVFGIRAKNVFRNLALCGDRVSVKRAS